VIDKLRPNARWKDKDPGVRAAAVADIPEDQAETLHLLARQDPDARVRLAALRRVSDPSLLAAVARGDEHKKVRDEASEMLVGLAAAAEETTALAALAGLDQPKHLGRVAREARSDSLRAAALERLSDTKALGSVARHASDASIRLAALGRLADEAEMALVA